MATFTEGTQYGALNGVTEVTLVSAPAASTRRILKSIKICNRDTASVGLHVAKAVAGARYRIISNMTLSVGDTLFFEEGDIDVLIATNQSIVAWLAGAIATTNPDFTAAYADVT